MPPVKSVKTATWKTWPYRPDVLGLTALFVDDRYQRPLSRFVKTIVEDFDPTLLGVLIVSERPDGRYAVVDGQTRLAALRQLGHLNALCLVYVGLSPEQEASLFRRLQKGRRNITALESFRAAVFERDPAAVDIADIADRCGFVLEKSNVGNAIQAVKALEETYDRYGDEMVEYVLEVIAGAWEFKRGKAANTNEMLRGLAYFADREDSLDQAKLIRRLSIVDPATLHTRASQLRQGRGMGGKSPTYMAQAIAAEYRRRKT